ncbi:hypothetical protein M404DRAFT_1004500, partial [Pisolithus tinctorius Marx 270]
MASAFDAIGMNEGPMTRQHGPCCDLYLPATPSNSLSSRVVTGQISVKFEVRSQDD